MIRKQPGNRTTRALLVCASLAASVAFTAQALGADAKKSSASSETDAAAKHVVALYTEGAKASDAKTSIRSALGDQAQIVDTDDFKDALKKAGQKLPFGIPITMESKRAGIAKKVAQAMDKVGAEVVVLGITKPKKTGGQEVLILVLRPGQDDFELAETVPLGKPDTDDNIASTLSPTVQAWVPEKKDDLLDGARKGGGGDVDKGEGDEDDEDDDGASKEERPKNVFGKEIFLANLSFDIGGRFFAYNDGITENLRDYSVFGTPGATIRIEVYPVAAVGTPFLRDLGLYGEFRGAFAISSETADGTEVPTQWLRGGGGLRYRLPVGDDPKAPFVFGLRGGFYRDAFSIAATGDLAKEAPSVDYSFLRVGLDMRLPIGPIAITAFGGYDGALDAGEVYGRFRESTIGGIDVGGGLTVPIAEGFEARLQAEYVRWFYAFGPTPGDEFVAGGALDENVHIEIGPQYVY